MSGVYRHAAAGGGDDEGVDSSVPSYRNRRPAVISGITARGCSACSWQHPRRPIGNRWNDEDSWLTRTSHCEPDQT